MRRGTDRKQMATAYLVLRPMGGICGHLHGNMAISSTSPVTNPIVYTATGRTLFLTPFVRQPDTKGPKGGIPALRGGKDGTRMLRFADRNKRGGQKIEFLITAAARNDSRQVATQNRALTKRTMLLCPSAKARGRRELCARSVAGDGWGGVLGFPKVLPGQNTLFTWMQTPSVDEPHEMTRVLVQGLLGPGTCLGGGQGRGDDFSHGATLCLLRDFAISVRQNGTLCALIGLGFPAIIPRAKGGGYATAAPAGV